MMRNLTKKEIEECENLESWTEGVSPKEIDAILEWLEDSQYLNDDGSLFLKRYWQHTWHDNKSPEESDEVDL